MNRERDKIKELKDEYRKMEIPKELDFAIQKGAEAGQGKRRRSSGWQQWLVGVAAAMMIFVTGVNLSPSFAETMEGVPFLGRLVQILVFVDNEASGGEVTDGLNVSEIESGQQEWIIRFDEFAGAAELAGTYRVKYSENPSVLTFQLSGVRMLEAKKDFQTLMESDLIEAVYPLITLDDSMVRFQIVFSQPITYQVEEYREPAGLKVSVQPLEHEAKQIFSLRSGSYLVGEAFAQLEEKLASWCIEQGVEANHRILKDREGGMVIEFGVYDTEEKAEQDRVYWSEALGDEVLIEARNSFSSPAVVMELNRDDFVVEESRMDLQMDVEYMAVQFLENETREVVLKVSATDLSVLDSEGKTIEEFSYDAFVFYKLHGEASFVLRVEGNEKIYVFSGLFSDFMEDLNQYEEIKE